MPTWAIVMISLCGPAVGAAIAVWGGWLSSKHAAQEAEKAWERQRRRDFDIWLREKKDQHYGDVMARAHRLLAALAAKCHKSYDDTPDYEHFLAAYVATTRYVSPVVDGAASTFIDEVDKLRDMADSREDTSQQWQQVAESYRRLVDAFRLDLVGDSRIPNGEARQ